ncbi:MAG: hypothetical protein B2I17_01960 [Thermoplasmatales archaeon B_DKE]|nr:MAG: hypothetical protein B2I17_01960 [Thermoplasmatales archaeon B_DKE]
MKEVVNIDNQFNKSEIRCSRLKCPLGNLQPLQFFSLVDYRNKLFTSDDPNKILEFYKGFGNRDQLIRWMKERPNGVHTIYEVDGNEEVIVVIPTADFNGKYAMECRNNIFKGLHMVFVESGGRGDFYFNGAHNINIGIKKAMEYNPKWIVFSGDDMYKVDEVNVLIDGLERLDNSNVDIVFTQPSAYHSSTEKLSKPNFLFKIYNVLYYKKSGIWMLKFHKKFQVTHFVSHISSKFSKLFKSGYKFLEIQDFAIFSANWVLKHSVNVYDETFINAVEDTDLSIQFSLTGDRIGKIDYKIGDMIGSTLGNGMDRRLRSIASMVYFSSKLETLFSKIRSLP